MFISLAVPFIANLSFFPSSNNDLPLHIFSDYCFVDGEPESETEEEKPQRGVHRLTILHRNLLANSKGNGLQSLKPKEAWKNSPQLKKHSRSQLGKIKNNPTELSDVKESITKEKVTEKKQWKICLDCGQSFKSNLSLSNHQRMHARQKPYKCSNCGERFTAKKLLASHQMGHAEEKGYKHPGIKKTAVKGHKIQPTKRPYKCTQCEKCFKLRDRLVKHQESHTRERPHKCSTCKKDFIRKEHLNRHLKTHTRPKNNKTSNDKEEAKGESLSMAPEQQSSLDPDHERTDTSDVSSSSTILHRNIYRCRFCGKCLRANSLLDSHERTHREERPYKCAQCEKSFHHNHLLQKHEKIHLKELDRKSPKRRMKSVRAKSSSSEPGKVSTTEKPLKSPVGRKIITRSFLLAQRQRMGVDKKTYKCQYCGKCLSAQSSLVKHERLHKEEKHYQCRECGEKFSQKHRFDRHLQSHTRRKLYEHIKKVRQLKLKRSLSARKTARTESKPSKGPIVTRNSCVARHMKIPTEDKPYKCQYCEKCMQTKSSLVNHEKIHKDKKPYKCLECGKSFFQKNHLGCHKRSHMRKKLSKLTNSTKKLPTKNPPVKQGRPQGKELPYICLKCGKSFDDKYHLTRHQITHSVTKPFQCDTCGKGFVQRWHLKRHERVHLDQRDQLGTRPFQCVKCGRVFMHMWHLKRHEKTHLKYYLTRYQRIHSKIKPFQCAKCGSCFIEAQHLKRHEKIHVRGKCHKQPHVTELHSAFSSSANGAFSREMVQGNSPVDTGAETASRTAEKNPSQNFKGKNPETLMAFEEGSKMEVSLRSEQGNINANTLDLQVSSFPKLKKNAPRDNREVQVIVGQLVKPGSKQARKGSHRPHRKQAKCCTGQQGKPRKCSKTIDLKRYKTEKACVNWQLRSRTKSVRKSKREAQLADKQPRSCLCQQEAAPEVTPGKKPKTSQACLKVKTYTGLEMGAGTTVSSRWSEKVLKRCKPRHLCHDKQSKMDPSQSPAKGILVCTELKEARARKSKGNSDFQCCKRGKHETGKHEAFQVSPQIAKRNAQRSCEQIRAANQLKKPALLKLNKANAVPRSKVKRTEGKRTLQSHKKRSAGTMREPPSSLPKDRLENVQAKYVCAKCKKSFRSQANLSIHEKYHTGDRPFECAECGKSFYALQALSVHVRIHTGEKPFKCSQCGYRCNVSSNLSRHKRTHNRERPHACVQCGKGFWFSHSLLIHSRMHV